MKSNRLMIASALCGIVAIAMAGTPCGWPQMPVIGGGGQCIDPLFGDSYCTQTHLITDGDCAGGNNPKWCGEGPAQQTYPYWILRDPVNACNASDPKCITNTQEVTVTYTLAAENGTNCISNP